MPEENEINIEDIQVLENTRTELGDLAELMSSIRQHGLLEPILVTKEADGKYILRAGNRRLSAVKKLGWNKLTLGKDIKILELTGKKEDGLVINLIENVQRAEINPVERGRIFSVLKEVHGLTENEIAARVSLSPAAVYNAIAMFKKVPEEFKRYVGYMQGAHNKKGLISPSVVNRITHARVSGNEDRKKLFKFARDNALTILQIRTITDMVTKGVSVEEAISKFGDYKITTMEFVFNKKVLDKFQKENKGKGITELMVGIVKGKIEAPKHLLI
jgi:ParB/RepB/Spo0J family partition protein